MVYPSPTAVNMSAGLPAILNYVNSVTDNWFSKLIMIGIYVIILIGFYKSKEDFKGAMAVAGFGVFVVGLLFFVAGFLDPISFSIAIGLFVVGLIVLLLDKQ